MKAIYKGASKELHRDCMYVYPGTVVEMSQEEFDFRAKKTPGLWVEHSDQISGDTSELVAALKTNDTKAIKEAAEKVAEEVVVTPTAKVAGQKVTK